MRPSRLRGRLVWVGKSLECGSEPFNESWKIKPEDVSSEVASAK